MRIRTSKVLLLGSGYLYCGEVGRIGRIYMQEIGLAETAARGGAARGWGPASRSSVVSHCSWTDVHTYAVGM